MENIKWRAKVDLSNHMFLRSSPKKKDSHVSPSEFRTDLNNASMLKFVHSTGDLIELSLKG